MATIGRPHHDIQIVKANIVNLIDYLSIYQETERWITKLSQESDLLSINLTSGTPAMTTLSVLIGKGKPMYSLSRQHLKTNYSTLRYQLILTRVCKVCIKKYSK